jgi:DNA-binding transcriptional ArsR family regulator
MSRLRHGKTTRKILYHKHMLDTVPDVSQVDEAQLGQCRRIAADWAPVLRALANEERLLIALWLAGNSCSVRELEQVTGMSQQLVSYHLRELRAADLVAASVEGRSNRYRLCCSDLDDLVSLIGRLESAARQADGEHVPDPSAA